jgi:hypothetical protein
MFAANQKWKKLNANISEQEISMSLGISNLVKWRQTILINTGIYGRLMQIVKKQV